MTETAQRIRKKTFHEFAELRVGSNFVLKKHYKAKRTAEYTKTSEVEAIRIRDSKPFHFHPDEEVRWIYEIESINVNDLGEHKHKPDVMEGDFTVKPDIGSICKRMMDNASEVFIVHSQRDQSAIQRHIRRKVNHDHPVSIKIISSKEDGDPSDTFAMAYLPEYVPKFSRPLETCFGLEPENNLDRYGSKRKLVRKLAESPGEEVELSNYNDQQIDSLIFSARTIYPKWTLNLRKEDPEGNFYASMKPKEPEE